MYATVISSVQTLNLASLRQIHAQQFIQSHTILNSLAHTFADTPTLVLGGRGDAVRKVAER